MPSGSSQYSFHWHTRVKRNMLCNNTFLDKSLAKTLILQSENFADLKTHRERGKRARASPTPYHTLHDERTARFFAQPLLFVRPDL